MLTKISGGNVIDPGKLDGIFDVFIKDNHIQDIKEHNQNNENVDKIIDAKGKIVTPGLFDMHVHLREPGYEYKETILSGCRAAAAGGFTSVCSMPNTNPVNDNRQVTEFIIEKAREAGFSKVYPVAAISKGLKGEGLCEYSDLIEAGAIAFSDDGMPVENGQLMRRALEYAKGFNRLIISHCEDLKLAASGVMNEGAVSTKLGLFGIPNISESIMVQRDIGLCELTNGSLHIAHVSTKESVQAIREAKKRGVQVTSETAPHYFTLTEKAVEDYRTSAKMNPPLRTRKDLEAIREGLADGTIDVIATDHAPHAPIEKDVEFDHAANGIIGLETSLSLGLKLVDKMIISLTDLIQKMSTNPAKILGIDNRLISGNPADLTIIDPEKKYSVDADHLNSLSKNTPFNGWELKGKALYTIVDGKIVFEDQ